MSGAEGFVFDRVHGLALALHATLREHCDPRSDDGFADALSALVSLSALTISEVGGNVVNHLEGAALFSEQLSAMILVNQTGELSAMYATERGK